MTQWGMDQLSDIERRLVYAITEGSWLDLSVEDGRSVRAEVIRQILIGNFRLPDGARPDPRGIRVRGAELEGQLDLTDVEATLALFLIDCNSVEPVLLTRAHLSVADFSGLSAPAVAADWVRVDHHLSMDRVRLHADQVYCTVALSEAKIGGRLSLNGAKLSSAAGPALLAEYLHTGGSVYLRRIEAVGSGQSGAIRLRSAQVAGALECAGARLKNDSGPALSAFNLTTGGGAFLHRDFRAEGVGQLGAINLQNAHIGDGLELDMACVVNGSGPGLLANNITTGRNIAVRNGTNIEGSGELGAVHLRNAHIGGQLSLRGARLKNSLGPALVANGVYTGGSVLLTDGFDSIGTVDLRATQINGQLSCIDHNPSQRDGLVLILRDARIANDLLLPMSFIGAGSVDLDGLTYRGVPVEASLAEWLTLLSRHTVAYKDQPYLQLAAAHQAAGQERDVRRVRIAQQKDLQRRGQLGAWGRLWQRIIGVTLGYGYRPAIALLWLAFVIATSIVLITGIAGPAGITVNPQGRSCSAVEQVGLALNAAVPLIKPDLQRSCQLLTATGIGQALTVATWILQALAWAFATLFIAGFTGFVRRST